MKIIICRTNWADEKTIEEHQRTSAPLVDADLKIVALQKGPDWTVCEYDAGLIAREMYEVAEAAEKDYDAFIVGSCSDSNARGIKELISDMVIVEPGAAALSVASFIADKFSVLTVKEPGIRAMVMKSVQRLGLESKWLLFVLCSQPLKWCSRRTKSTASTRPDKWWRRRRRPLMRTGPRQLSSIPSLIASAE